MKMIAKSIFVLAFTVFSVNGYAFGIGDVTGGGKEESKSSGASVDDVAAQQEALVQKYVSASKNVNEAQLKIAKALDLKGEVAGLEDTANVLGSGSVQDADAIEKISETSARADKAISKKIEEGADLSDESKKELAASLLPYAMGLKEAKSMSDEFKPFLSSAMDAISNASMTQKMSAKKKLAAGMYVAKNTPGLVKNLLTTSQKLLSYAKSQNAEVPKEATDALGNL